MAEAIEYKVIGTRPVRPDGIDKVTGRAMYGADLILPNMLYGKVLRSPYAHARIKSVDLTKALAMDGVYAAISGADFPEARAGSVGGEAGGNITDLAKNIMARDKVLYHGHAVAAVAAKTSAIAEAALQTIDVEYEPLAAVFDLDEAMQDGSPLVDENCFTKNLPEKPDKPSNIASVMQLARGDVEQGFADADVIVEGDYHIAMSHQGYIEPHACVANANEGGQATVWCCTQGHFEFRTQTAAVLDMNVADLKFTASEIGGGFGGKTVIYLEPLAVLLSRNARRPVKMVMTREEVFRASGPGAGSHCRVKLGAKKDGTLTAATAWIAMEAGAFAGSPMGPAVMTALASYKLDNFRIDGFDVLVNKPKVAAYRAPGAPQSIHAVESAMDDLARELNVDPIDLRLKNAAEEGTEATYGPKFAAVGLKECLEAAKAHPNYSKPLAEGVGRGVAVGFWFNVGMQSSAEVHVNENGTVTIIEGNPDIGGTRASMCQMAAETLGIPYDQFRIQIGDTESAGFTNLTGGSRTTFATGMAVVGACEDIISQCKARAAATWGMDEDQVEWDDGQAVPAPGVNADVKPLSLAEIAASAARTGGPLLGRASLNAQGAGPTFSVNICDLKVDKETGKADVVGYTCIQDAGKAIHPSYVEGQMQGGASQGLGWALNEEYIFDENGVLENPGFLDYRVPVASDLPMIDCQIVEVPNPSHPYGVRGAGETPIVAPLGAAANAMRDAIGVRVCDLPMSPPRVVEALERG